MPLFTPLSPTAKPYIVKAVGPDDHDDFWAAEVCRGPGPAAEWAGWIAVLCGCGLVVSLLGIGVAEARVIPGAVLDVIGLPLAVLLLLGLFATACVTPVLALAGVALGLPGLLWRRGRRAARRGLGLSAVALTLTYLVWAVVLPAVFAAFDY
jgi:hypothetical protein